MDREYVAATLDDVIADAHDAVRKLQELQKDVINGAGLTMSPDDAQALEYGLASVCNLLSDAHDAADSLSFEADDAAMAEGAEVS